MTNVAIENGHRNSGFSHEKWWIFPVRYVSHYQRVIVKIGFVVSLSDKEFQVGEVLQLNRLYIWFTVMFSSWGSPFFKHLCWVHGFSYQQMIEIG